MPVRSANVCDDVYNHIQKKMELSGKSYSYHVNEMLVEQMNKEKETI